MDSWVDCWLVVYDSDDGIRTHASRPRMIRNTAPFSLAFATFSSGAFLLGNKLFFNSKVKMQPLYLIVCLIAERGSS